MKRIESLLREQIGLDAASIGSSMIERTVRLRMKARGVADLDGYKCLLESSRAAWDELVEAAVVTETWFFRDHEPFRAFAELVQAGRDVRARRDTALSEQAPYPRVL